MRGFDKGGFLIWGWGVVACVGLVVRGEGMEGLLDANATALAVLGSSTGFVTSSQTSSASQNSSHVITSNSSWASVLSCNEEWASYERASSSYAQNTELWEISSRITSGVTTSTLTSTTHNFTGPIITLCDGVPRGGKRETVYSTYYVTNSFSYTHKSTIRPNYTAATPLCSIGTKDCSSLGEVYHSWLSTATDLSAPHISPFCTSSAYTTCAQCTLYGANQVQLYYWPVTGDARTLCPNSTTTALKASAALTAPPRRRAAEPVTATIGDLTFVSPSVYLHFKNLHALDISGAPCGTVTQNRTALLSLQPDELSSQHGYKGNGGTTSFNLEDLAYTTIGGISYPLVPSSAYWYPNSCCGMAPEGRACPFAVSTCTPSTVYDGYRPKIAFPTQITDIDPSWAHCEPFWSFEGTVDPPVALKPADALVGTTTTRHRHVPMVTTAPAEPSSPVGAPFASMTAPAAEPVREPSTRAGAGAGAGAVLLPSVASSNPETGPTTGPSLAAADPGTVRPTVPDLGTTSEPGTRPFEFRPTGTSTGDAGAITQDSPAVSGEGNSRIGFQDPEATSAVEDPEGVSGDSARGSTPAAAAAAAVVTIPLPPPFPSNNDASASGTILHPTSAATAAPIVTTLQLNGPAATIGDQVLSLAPEGIVVAGSTLLYSALDSAGSGAVGGSTVAAAAGDASSPVSAAVIMLTPSGTAHATTITAQVGAPLVMGDTTLLAGGLAGTVGGRVFSLASGGVVVVDGVTHAFSTTTAPIEGVVLTLGPGVGVVTVVKPTDAGTGTGAASVVLTAADGPRITAFLRPASGSATGAVVLADGRTLEVGGGAVAVAVTGSGRTMGEVLVSAVKGGIVVLESGTSRTTGLFSAAVSTAVATTTTRSESLSRTVGTGGQGSRTGESTSASAEGTADGSAAEETKTGDADLGRRKGGVGLVVVGVGVVVLGVLV